jgi:hypothetical protein
VTSPTIFIPLQFQTSSGSDQTSYAGLFVAVGVALGPWVGAAVVPFVGAAVPAPDVAFVALVGPGVLVADGTGVAVIVFAVMVNLSPNLITLASFKLFSFIIASTVVP